MKVKRRADQELARRFCAIKKCGHSPQAHAKNLLGKFMGERGRCNYSRCSCMGFVPKGWKPPPQVAAKNDSTHLDAMQKTGMI